MATWTHQDILESIDEGKLRLAERQAEYDLAEQRRLDEENARIDAAWQPIIARIKESIPEWAWNFLTYPQQEPTYDYGGYDSPYVTMRRPARIDLQGMGLVFAYVDGQNAPMFAPARWYLADDDEAWSVKVDNGGAETRYSLPGDPDFLIALAQAYENMAGFGDLMAEAARRNIERAASTPEPPPTNWLEIAKSATGPNTDGNIAAIAYALIGILEQLRLVITPLRGGGHAIETYDNSRCQV